MRFSFVLQDGDIYYLVFLDKCYVSVEAFENIKGKFISIFNMNVQKLTDYFYDYVYSKNFYRNLIDLKLNLNFNVPIQAKNKLGDSFCKHFIKDYDLNFLHQDIYAKHFIPNWKAIENKKGDFLIQPQLFPFYISYLDVLIDENYDIFYKSKRIPPSDVYLIEKKYKQSLIPLIKRKNRIYEAMLSDLKNRYYKTKNFINSMNLWYFNLYGHLEVFDIADNVIFEEFIHFENYDFSDCNLSLYGINVKINYLLWRLINIFGLRFVEAKVSVWSEIKTDLQKSFKI